MLTCVQGDAMWKSMRNITKIVTQYIPGMNNSLDLYRSLYINLYMDIAERHCVPTKVRDIEIAVINRRFEKEGISFLTKTLPAYGKAVDKTLATGEVLNVPELQKEFDTDSPKLFLWLTECFLLPDGSPRFSFYLDDSDDGEMKSADEEFGFALLDFTDIPMPEGSIVWRGWGLPYHYPVCWPQSWLIDLRDTYAQETGYRVVALKKVDFRVVADALADYRQLAYFLYKLELDSSKESEDRVINEFLETEKELSQLDFSDRDPILTRTRTLITRLLGSFDHTDIIPQHGSGSVSTGENVFTKTVFKRIYKKLDRVYPFTEYFMLPSQVCDEYDWLQTMSLREGATAKVILVPKDSRGPRLISCEPMELMWIQQGLGRKLMTCLETKRLTKGRVNFVDQTINRSLALIGSLDNSVVTLDMKEASDRVSWKLVETLFRGTRLLEGLEASRSQETKLPDGRIIPLLKFAPMGSCLCFPVEALVFWALSVCSLMVHKQYKLSYASKRVWVYGDDIICHSEDYAVVMRCLPKFGLKFNLSKCCTGSFGFRESCGMDAYFGHSVTPLRMKSVWSRFKPDGASELTSFVEFGNNLERRGYTTVSSSIRQLVERRYGVLPVYSGDSSPAYIGWWTDFLPVRITNRSKKIKSRYNKRLQRIELKTLCARPETEVVKEMGWKSVLRHLHSKRIDKKGHRNIYALVRRSLLIRTWAPEQP